MAIQQKQTKAIRRRYSAGFKVEALGLAEQVGVSSAANRFNKRIYSHIEQWRNHPIKGSYACV